MKGYMYSLDLLFCQISVKPLINLFTQSFRIVSICFRKNNSQHRCASVPALDISIATRRQYCLHDPSESVTPALEVADPGNCQRHQQKGNPRAFASFSLELEHLKKIFFTVDAVIIIQQRLGVPLGKRMIIFLQKCFHRISLPTYSTSDNSILFIFVCFLILSIAFFSICLTRSRVMPNRLPIVFRVQGDSSFSP